MIACKRIVTITDPRKVVLSDLPFEAGQRVEIVMIAEQPPRAAVSEELRSLLKATQALPSAQAVTEDQIAEEISGYRMGH